MANRLHLPHAHVPHVPTPFTRIDVKWMRGLPVALVVIVILAAILIVASFAISKALTGQAY